MESKADVPKTPIKINLMKSRSYNWEIHCQSETVDEVLATIKEADTKLRNEYLKDNGAV